MGLLTANIHTQRQAGRTPLTSLGADGASAKRRANRARAGNARPRPRGRDLGLLPSPELHDQGWSATQRPVAVAPGPLPAIDAPVECTAALLEKGL